MFTVLWDNDGVLVDTEGLYFQACEAALRTAGVSLSPEQFIEISLCRGASVFELAVAQGATPGQVARLRAERNDAYLDLLRDHARAVDGVEDVLQALCGHVRMGVVTSTHRQRFEVIHARTGLGPYFDFVVAYEDCEHCKPHPEPYLTALSRHGVEPSRCLVVEDSPRGLVSATAAGLECLVVLSEWSRSGDFTRACRVLEDISEVPGEVMKRLRRSG